MLHPEPATRPAAAAPPRDPWPWHLALLAGYLALGILATWPLAAHALAAVPGFDSPLTRGGMADQDQNLWAQWWLRQALFVRHTNPLSTDLLYWPYYREGISLLLYDMQLLRGVLALPIQITLGLAAAYNWGIFLSFMLGGYGMFLLGRDWGLSRPAAALGGLIFVAGPFHLAELFWETSLVIVEALPFALLWSRRALRTGQPRAIGLAVLCIVWANLSFWYFGLYALIALGVLAVGYAWHRRRGGWPAVRPILGRLLLVGAGYGLLYSPFLLPLAAQVAQAPPGSGLFLNIATIRGASMQWYHLFMNDRDPLVQPAQWHGTGFLGYTAVALAVAGCVLAWRRAWPWLLLFGVFLNLAMGPDLHGFGQLITFPNGDPVPLPYAFLLHLPGMTLLRAPGHAAIMLLLCAAFLAGLGLDAVAARLAAWRPRFRRALPGLAAAAGILALLEYLTIPIPLYTLAWPAVFTAMGADPGNYGVFGLPVTLHASNDHHRMFDQIAHGKGIDGGYFPRPVPDPYRAVDSPLAQFTQPYTATALLAQDGTAASEALLQLMDFRYLAIYPEPKDYRVGNSPWTWPWPVPPLPGGSAEVTVYPVPPAPLDRTYLYLGGTWDSAEGTDGTAQRPLSAAEGDVIAWSPGGTGALTLDLATPGPAAAAITLTLETQPLLRGTIAPGAPQRLQTPPLALAPGWYHFRLTTDAPPAGLVLTRAAWAPAR